MSAVEGGFLAPWKSPQMSEIVNILLFLEVDVNTSFPPAGPPGSTKSVSTEDGGGRSVAIHPHRGKAMKRVVREKRHPQVHRNRLLAWQREKRPGASWGGAGAVSPV